MAWLMITAVVAVLLAVAWLARPRRVRPTFSHVPPVIARVNAPSKLATEEMRRIDLPTGDRYIIPAGSRGHFVIVFDWPVTLLVEGESLELTIPKLMTTDFASIPRPLHSLISPLNNTVYGAILHDYLYRDPQDPRARDIDRRTADRMFYWMMRARGVWRVTAGIMYLAVRLAGWSAYRR